MQGMRQASISERLGAVVGWVAQAMPRCQDAFLCNLPVPQSSFTQLEASGVCSHLLDGTGKLHV